MDRIPVERVGPLRDLPTGVSRTRDQVADFDKRRAQVRWRQDSRELFYVALDGQMMAVPIRLDSNSQAVEAGAPTALFHTRGVGGAVRGVNRQQYVVSPDGQRFLINALSEESVVAPITLILNWRPGR